MGRWSEANRRYPGDVAPGAWRPAGTTACPWRTTPAGGSAASPSGRRRRRPPLRPTKDHHGKHDDPDHPHAWLERGYLKSRQGQYEGAIADYDQAIRLDPRNAGAYANRSLAKSELGRHDEALEDLDQAMRLDPDAVSELGGP